MSQPIAEPTDPIRSPTYPQRVHIRERAKWRELLQTWDDRIASAFPSGIEQGDLGAKLFAQIAGCRDQMADAARRMPTEVGDLYEEDHDLMESALAALERCFAGLVR